MMDTNDAIRDLVEAGYEHVARDRYGDDTVDAWFRDVDGCDPDACR